MEREQALWAEVDGKGLTKGRPTLGLEDMRTYINR